MSSHRPRVLALIAGAAVAAGLLAAGCSRGERELEPGPYRAVLTVDGRELPFGLDIAREESGYVLYVLNGRERVRVTEVQVHDSRVLARMPGYDNTLDARIGRGRLDGTMTLLQPGGRRESLPFAARLGETWRFFEKPSTDNADVSGRWSVRITTDTGATLGAVAELSQEFAQVDGTILTAFGDARFLSGEVHGDELYLSRFDGGFAHLYKARVTSSGQLQGESWGNAIGHYRWTADRNPDAVLDVTTTTERRSDQTSGPLEFTAPDLEGRTVTQMDPRFVGKVVIVTVSGSWCPNCHDEAVLLNQLYEAYHERGLEIVSLMFEYHEDPALAKAAVLRFRDQHRIAYPLLLAGSTDEGSIERALPQSSGIYAYPTTLVLDRRGRVRRVDSGFTGPATGARYDSLRYNLTHYVEALLAEPPAT